MRVSTSVRWTEFRNQLFQNGSYATPPTLDQYWPSRLFGGLDAWYYGGLAREVWEISRDARRGGLTAERFGVTCFWILQHIERCRGHFTIEGGRTLAAIRSPVVYVANHMSLLETFVIGSMLTTATPVTFVLKESLMRVPVFGHILRALGAIAVTRRDPREDFKTVMHRGPECIRAGTSVIVFPQATRSPTFRPADFNTLGVKLARKAGVPLVPVALKTDFMGVGRVFRDLGAIRRDRPIHFRFGEPIDPRDPRATHAECIRFIATALREWGGQIDETPNTAAPEEPA